MVSALDCNTNKHNEYSGYASMISYESSYSKSTSSFTITVNNVIDGMKVVYNNKSYHINSDNSVIIDGIKEGTNMNISVFADDGCDEIRIININIPYYNSYYGSELCSGYEDKIVFCSSQFTSTKTSESLIKDAINNYNNAIITDDEEEVVEEEESFYSKLVEFALNWGIKIVLFIISVVLSIAFYNSKLRKLKHGI